MVGSQSIVLKSRFLLLSLNAATHRRALSIYNVRKSKEQKHQTNEWPQANARQGSLTLHSKREDINSKDYIYKYIHTQGTHENTTPKLAMSRHSARL